MNYDELLESHLKYGTTKEDIVKMTEYESILENVVIAPWWEHTLFEEIGFTSTQVSTKVFNMAKGNNSFSFIEVKEIGAPLMMEYVLPLGLTKCKNLIFLGAAGSIDKDIKIGDIVIPEYSICGDGASRYLNKNLEDEFGKKEYPYGNLTKDLIKLLDNKKIEFHCVPNYSVDTVIGEFYHVDKFIDMRCKTIEMETACLFKCCNTIKMNVTAIFVVSDNILVNKSLYSGRSEEEKERKKYTKHNIIPKLVEELFNK